MNKKKLELFKGAIFKMVPFRVDLIIFMLKNLVIVCIYNKYRNARSPIWDQLKPGVVETINSDHIIGQKAYKYEVIS